MVPAGPDPAEPAVVSRTLPGRLLVRPVRHWWRMHPRLGLALRTSIAGGLAWLVAQLLPGQEAQHYAYFAPMGAVVVTSTTVAATTRELVRSVAALALGSALGLLALAVVRPSAVSVAVVIAVSVILAGWRPLGSMRAWVPTVAIFTLVLGRGQPWTYVSAYTGLSALGAAIAATVVTLIPQLTITPLDEAVQRLWLSVTERLRLLRDDLQDGDREASFGTDLPDTTNLDTARRRVEVRLAEAEEARRINRRSRRYDVDARLQRARAVHRLALRLLDVQRRLEELARPEESGAQEEPGTPEEPQELEQPLADAVELIRNALQQGSTDDLDDSLEPALAELDEVLGRYRTAGPGRHTISSLVNDLRRLGLAAGEAIRYSVSRD